MVSRLSFYGEEKINKGDLIFFKARKTANGLITTAKMVLQHVSSESLDLLLF